MISSSVDKHLSEILDIISNVSSSYGVWKELTDISSKGAYLETKENYEDFFLTIEFSTFSTVITGLYMIYDKNSKSHSIYSLLKEQRSQGHVYESKVDSWLSEISTMNDLIKKVIIIRSNVYAHRSQKLSTIEAMEKASITPDQIYDLISYTSKFLEIFTDMASFGVRGVICDFSGSTKLETMEIMQKLQVENA